MIRNFTLKYWLDDGWYVGQLQEIPSVISQGETLNELEENIQDAYRLIVSDASYEHQGNVQTKEIGVEV